MRMFPNNSKSVHSVKEKYDSSETTEIYTVQILYISVNNLNWTELNWNILIIALTALSKAHVALKESLVSKVYCL